MEWVKPKSKAFEELFEEPLFSLSLDILKERGGEPNPNLLRNFYQLMFGYFSSKGGGGLSQIQAFY